jgi:hypothetical protein
MYTTQNLRGIHVNPNILSTMVAAKIAGSAAVALVGGGALCRHWANDELGEAAVERTISFYEVAVPAFIDYKLLEFKCEKLNDLVKGTPLETFYPPVSRRRGARMFTSYYCQRDSKFEYYCSCLRILLLPEFQKHT